MIVGNGLLARTFVAYKDVDSVLIFASGVSNSSNIDLSAFEREQRLLESHVNIAQKFVYFSTISVLDPALSQTPYILHKIKLEQIIRDNAQNYIIFRLPILLGRSPNPFTLCNFIFNQLLTGSVLKVYTQACRYIIDVDDLASLLPKFINDENYSNSTINVNYSNAIGIDDLISIFEKVTSKQAIREYVDKGGCYHPDNSTFMKLVHDVKVDYSGTYLLDRIAKYYSGR